MDQFKYHCQFYDAETEKLLFDCGSVPTDALAYLIGIASRKRHQIRITRELTNKEWDMLLEEAREKVKADEELQRL